MNDNWTDNRKTLALPEALPEGEYVVWQCAPSSIGVARHALFASWVALYFGILMLSAAVTVVQQGGSVINALSASWHLIAIGLATTAALAGIGVMIRRSTVYTITNKRVVMQIGMAVPLRLNLPFHKIASADLKVYGDGTGDIALTPAEALPVTYVHLWPHAQGFHLFKPRPALRAIDNARDVSALLVRAMVASGVPGARRANEVSDDAQGAIEAATGGQLAISA